MNITTLYSSLPFLDDNYPHGKLLGAVCAMRVTRAENRGVPFRSISPDVLLSPDDATRSTCLMLETAEPTFESISSAEEDLVRNSIEKIRFQMPVWEPLFGIPMRYRKIPDHVNAISGSAQKWPQQILLSSRAFSEEELPEQIIHEHCHQWQYLIQELFPSNQYSEDYNYTLPSGTGKRSPSEVLGAAHVAFTLHRYYRETHQYSQLQDLRAYAESCVDILSTLDARLTDSGRTLRDYLIHKIQFEGAIKHD